MKIYEVNISKSVFKYYTHKIEALNEEDAVKMVIELIANGQLRDNDLVHSQDEPDYGIEDDPSAYTVVDAIECEQEGETQ